MTQTAAAPPDRRGPDRRRGERRRHQRRGPAAAAPSADRSWFGPQAPEAVDSSAHSDLGGADSGGDLQFFSQPTRRLVEAGGSAFQRLYRAFLSARAALGLALVGTQLLVTLFGNAPPSPSLPLCGFYALQALLLWLLPQWRHGASAQSLSRLSSPQWWASIGFDLALFGVLHGLDRSAGLS